jgi:hypothetical protein
VSTRAACRPEDPDHGRRRAGARAGSGGPRERARHSVACKPERCVRTVGWGVAQQLRLGAD